MTDINPNPVKAAMQSFSRLFFSLVARIHVTGLENVPERGPLLVLGNHLSTIDAPLIMAFLPPGMRFVGPGDFKLLFPANLFLKWSGVIQVKRSNQLERSSLKRMTEVLTGGGKLGLFPEGGTWEKSIFDAKPGAAYLSLTTGASILPIGLGGTYRAWYKVGRLQRPHLHINVGKVMPPVTAPDRSKRTEALENATREIMQRIYDLLPAPDRAQYDDWARRRYALGLEVWHGDSCEKPDLPGGAALAEVMLKPNLLSPLVNNLRLPLDPFRYPGIRFLPASVRLAVNQLNTALHSTLTEYMEYRLGDEKAKALYTALDALLALVEQPGVTGIVFRPDSTL